MAKVTRAGWMLGGLRGLGRALQRLPRWAGCLLAIGWVGFIWMLSEREGGSEPASFWSSWGFNLAHAPLFGLVALWLLVAFPRDEGWPQMTLRLVLLTLVAVLLNAVGDELHQAQVVGRDSSIFDVLTDFVGACCTLWLAAYVGSAAASPRGVLVRLGAGLGLCALSALIATLAS